MERKSHASVDCAFDLLLLNKSLLLCWNKAKMTVPVKKEIEVIVNEVEEGLACLGLEELSEVCSEIDLPVPEAKKSNKNKLFRHLLSYLWAEADKGEDGKGGEETYRAVHQFLLENDKLLTPSGEDDVDRDQKEEKGVKNEVVTDTVTKSAEGDDSKTNFRPNRVTTVSNDDSTKSTVTKSVSKSNRKEDSASPHKQRLIEVQKYQTLKFIGIIGSEKNNISYDDLSSQISNARKVGYTDPIICGAITKAICPTNVLRSYFETVEDLEVDSMVDILQPYFKQTTKDSGTYFTDLTKAKQRSPDKNAMDFAVRVLGLKNRVISLSAEEGAPFNKKLLFRTLHKSIGSGIKNLNIRSEVRDGIRSFSVVGLTPDPDYLNVVAEAIANENIRLGKFGGDSVSLNAVEGEYDTEDEEPALPPKRSSSSRKGMTKNKENLLPAKVDKQAQDIQVLQANFNKLQVQNESVLKMLEQNNTMLAAQAQVNSLNFGQQNQAQSGFVPNMNAPAFVPTFPQHQMGRGRGFGHGGNRGRGGNRLNNQGVNRVERKCPACHENKVDRCLHCYFCGRDDHRLFNCPDIGVAQGPSGNG